MSVEWDDMDEREKYCGIGALTWIVNVASKVRLQGEFFFFWSEWWIEKPKSSKLHTWMWKPYYYLSILWSTTSNSKHCFPPASRGCCLCPLNVDLLSIIPRVSLPLGWLVSNRLHTHHTHVCKCTCLCTLLLQLIKIQLHPRLPNGPNNRLTGGLAHVRQITKCQWTRQTSPWQPCAHSDTSRQTTLIFMKNLTSKGCNHIIDH